MSAPELKHFKPAEFREWYPMMNHALLAMLDAFREAWGCPVIVSPANGGLGRHDGADNTSMHNIDWWGEVRAVDVFPMVDDDKGGFVYMSTAAQRQRALDVARKVGFTGIGLYTDTRPGNMLHVDNRDGQHVATWSRINGKYYGIAEVLK